MRQFDFPHSYSFQQSIFSILVNWFCVVWKFIGFSQGLASVNLGFNCEKIERHVENIMFLPPLSFTLAIEDSVDNTFGNSSKDLHEKV